MSRLWRRHLPRWLLHRKRKTQRKISGVWQKPGSLTEIRVWQGHRGRKDQRAKQVHKARREHKGHRVKLDRKVRRGRKAQKAQEVRRALSGRQENPADITPQRSPSRRAGKCGGGVTPSKSGMPTVAATEITLPSGGGGGILNVTDDGNGNVEITGISVTDDGNGNVVLG